MSKKRITYIHIFIWLFAIFANLPYTAISQNLPAKIIVGNLIGFLYLMLVFYIFYLFMVPKFLNRKKLELFFSLSFIVVLVMPFFGYTILLFSRALFEGNFHNFYHDYNLKLHMSAYFHVLTAAVFGSFFGVIINWFKTMNQKAELDKQKLAVELDLLKSKLNPHFLFNTLNNIDSLIHQNSEEASAALIRLSDMMRYLTYETASETVNLAKEVDYMQNFIELHRMRIKTPEDISFGVKGNLDVMIAPALFVPLIENAFKFASFRLGKPCVDIKLSSIDSVLVFDISNYYEPGSNVSRPGSSGAGLLNLRKRLELTYPGQYKFVTDPGEFLYHVNLTIALNAN
jgi:two-component system, LytTR family, sensor kinase